MTCWFIAYLARRHGETSWTPQEATTFGEHPVEYVARARQTHTDHEYRLTFFTPIPEDVFHRLTDDEPGAVPQAAR